MTKPKKGLSKKAPGSRYSAALQEKVDKANKIIQERNNTQLETNINPEGWQWGSTMGSGTSYFVTKDSGVREEYDSGMVRDTQKGKPDYTLIDRPFLARWAALMTRGAEKYGRNNWRKANSEEELQRFKASALRHMYQWLDGDTEEDHAAAVCFNLAAAEYVWDKLLRADD